MLVNRHYPHFTGKEIEVWATYVTGMARLNLGSLTLKPTFLIITLLEQQMP